ncbi:olfactory receptor 6M1-like [Pseudophryne corroboree]|uniref:olfactory receptor 6M1-like n=1 Tax=Pseudophryne corroboree TaxID=495146 RepID=UPI003081F428
MVFADQKNLTYIESTKGWNSRQAKWPTQDLDLAFIIQPSWDFEFDMPELEGQEKEQGTITVTNKAMTVQIIHLKQCGNYFTGNTLLSLDSALNLQAVKRSHATWLDKRLHIPMYFFLSSLAFLDTCLISCTVPKLLTILVYNQRTISLSGCIVQLYFYVSFGTIEMYHLAVMSVDRYVAICLPLRYHSIFTNRVCLWLVLLSWIFGFITFFYPILLILDLSFCGPYELNHFFCDSSALVKISCSDVRQFDMVFSIYASAIILGSFFLTLISYNNILITVLMIPSTSGKLKAFSTCTSHLTVVTLTYGSSIFIYVRPVESSSPDYNKSVALLNSIMTPVLNPFIYSLRNKQVQKVFRDLWSKMVLHKRLFP